jgi:ATP-dependent Clp protease ATP-binding subunit ClpC
MEENTAVMTGSVTLKFEYFFNLIQEGGKYQIQTPDGWGDIGDIYLKKNKVKKEVNFKSGYSIITSEDHLFEILTTEYDEKDEIFDRIECLDNSFWIRSMNLKKGDKIISKDSYEEVNDVIDMGIGDTYDLEVLHENHRYWSGEIASHNTGKSSIAEGLAQRIIERKCSRVLFDKRVVILDLASMVAGTKYRGQFEERVKSLMNELEKNPDVILFIDEIHTMIGAGGASGSMDASNMFKPALARGEIQIIGATTLEEYRKHIEKDGALERRFQKVVVEPATPEETLQILNNIKKTYEDHHLVTYTDDAIKACIDLTTRYMTERHLPDKAIDALDESGSRVHISNIQVPKTILDIEKKINDISLKKKEVVRAQRYEEASQLRDVEKQLTESLKLEKEKWETETKSNRKLVTEEDVAKVVSMMTGIPVTKVNQSENDKLSNMYEVLSSRVIGQDEALKKVVKAIQRGRIGMKDPGKPTLVAMCIGSSGSGKTEMAKQIAKYMFESEDSMIRIDMSEYMEKFSVNRIIGSPGGYIGYDDSNLLDQIRRKPYSVILMDEVEKAHPDVYNIFLQAFDDGQMTDSHGRKVSFKNCIILMTSNVGARVVKEFGSGVGFSTKSKNDSKESDIKGVLEKELKKKFAPEFINRIDEIIYFNDLTKDNIKQILNLELQKSYARLNQLGFTCELEDSLLDKLIEDGYQPEYGARPMKRTIQKWVDDSLTDALLLSPKSGSHFILSYDSENEITKVDVKAKKRKKRDE